MLDHVMPWVTRVLVGVHLIQECFTLWSHNSRWSSGFWPDHMVLWSHGSDLWPVVFIFGIKGLVVDERLWTLAVIFLCAIWFLCLWNLQKTIARSILGCSAALFIFGTIWMMVLDNYLLANLQNSPSPYILVGVSLIVFGMPLLCYVSMIWVSLRPPQSFKNSEGRSLNHPLPQSC